MVIRKYGGMTSEYLLVSSVSVSSNCQHWYNVPTHIPNTMLVYINRMVVVLNWRI